MRRVVAALFLLTAAVALGDVAGADDADVLPQGRFRLFSEGRFYVSGLYRYGFKLEDDVSGKKGFRYRSLEEETARTEHIAIGGVSYSTNLYQAKACPAALVVSLSYRNRFAGSNNSLRSQYLALTLQVFF